MQITVGRIIGKSILYWLRHAMMRVEFFLVYVIVLFFLMRNGIHTYYVAWTFPIAVLCDVISLLVHEMGHFCLGCMGGFRLFDLGIPFILIRRKKDGWIVEGNMWHRYYCSMVPKKEKQNYKTYYRGGYVANILIALLAIFAWKMNFIFMCGISLYNFGTGIKNMIPNRRRSYSDGTVIRFLKEIPRIENCIAQQMYVNEGLLLGKDLKKLPISLAPIVDKSENDFSFFTRMMHVYLHLEQGEIEPAINEMLILEKNISEYSNEMQNFFLAEKLFLDSLLMSEGADNIYELYSNRRRNTYRRS